MGRKKRASPAMPGAQLNGSDQKKQKQHEESYPVKKYRPERHYAAMDAFVKYTKAHRMTDAKYLRWHKGVTPEKPFVFSTRVGGVDLGWGRGKTREAAMDAACRAAFALVSAHGYNNFPVDEDCLTTEPVDVLPPPPQPPPPTMAGGLPPLPPGYAPPLPPGVPPPVVPPPPLPVAPPPPASDLIPQARVMEASLPVASSLSAIASATTQAVSKGDQVGAAPVSLSLTAQEQNKKKLKGGLTLVFDAESDSPEDLCMEERRASLGRYQKLLPKAVNGS
jgi:hypothetical protein|mmetsp:Transcript_29114/g.52684  ORF Transcript_29114/g.52684 Transcript_29114/m.52684 type:complete len:278 (-) Transcript_29114:558-1391(-)|eukprot:CAMPEP_0202500660 /NCGR_PEP_ID=MMETSP1361-20130828/33757_1 /ASSEMBLY_ACC=CAM_ASM_000849 /TAXON_ID=210615 /ORGANISM="Staurosira complex sp., Strain CCMP2646" /LENGTH=277 /DNA_ID=CAMNT_0049133173 /DNA_START=34 /DNA_END=867 /DNA_ORIENTATION=-